MSYLDLLYESINRSLSHKVRMRRKTRLKKALLRSYFFRDLEESKGKILLNFFEISEPYTFHTKTKDVSTFLCNTLQIPLKLFERGIIFDYLKELGAHKRRTRYTTFFSNLKIKEEYATYSINGLVKHKPPKRTFTDDFD